MTKFKFVESDRFKVAPTCPCGKSNKDGKFAAFILEGRTDPALGHCYSCGESFFPRGAKENKPAPFREPLPEKPVRFVPPALVKRTLKSYHLNNLAIWLQETYPTIAGYLLQHFSIGTTRDGGTIFWYQDRESRFRKPKKMYYKPDGHRIRPEENEKKGKPSPIHFTNKKGYEYCLFGEFQLGTYPATAKIAMVESEKSALIGHAHFPDFIWIATGGAVSLKKERAAVLAGRKVMILPDMHQTGREGALRMQEILKEVGCKTRILEIDKTREDGNDIADILVKNNFKNKKPG